MTPLVSIIIPCYNTERFVAEAIGSALAQTMTKHEVIIVDDGSTDGSAEIVKSFTDQRIKYIYQENRGLSGARNTGIRQARGKYLSFLDADDTILPTKLELQTQFLESHPEFSVVAGSHMRVDEAGRSLYLERMQAGEIPPESVMVQCPFSVHVLLVRTEDARAIGLFDESFRRAEDWDFHCRMAIAGKRMWRHDELVADYRVTTGSLSANAELQVQSLLRVVEKTFSNPSLPAAWRPLEPLARATQHLSGAGRCFMAGESNAGRQHLMAALRLQPEWLENEGRAVAFSLGNWTSYLEGDKKQLFIEAVLQSLPEELHPRPFGRRMRQSVARQQLTDSWRRRSWMRFCSRLLLYGLNYPDDLLRLARRG